MHPGQRYLVKPDSQVNLSQYDPDDTGAFADKQEALAELKSHRKKLIDLQNLLYAEGRHALLVVLQAMDAGGKDGTISHIFSGVNPQGCSVTSFKVPTELELRHDFLWRVHKAAPPMGMIGIFNRSHYEDVLVVRVHQKLSQQELKRRFQEINDFEQMLAHRGTAIVKFFLHISKEEQHRRFMKRLQDPQRRWKVSESDFKERRYWDDYQQAYEDVFRHCSTEVAPWYVVPANKKWFRNVTISQILVKVLEELKMSYPKPALKKPARFD